jgi:hypothetical protein
VTSPSLVILAAGLATRYGALKQLAPVGPSGEALIEYAAYDARRAGFARVVFVIRREIEDEFRRHVDGAIGDAWPVRYAFQEQPAARKPWGAAHALLAARHLLEVPFAVANADDFYGADAYRRLYDCLTTPVPPVPSAPHYAVAGYRLDETLSPHGGVSRATCALAGGFVVRIEEMSDVRREGDAITGVGESGARRPVDGEAIVCTNLWGFTPALFPTLERQVSGFIEAAGPDTAAELALSTALAEHVATGAARIRVLRPAGRCFGMTFREDLPAVRRTIAQLVHDGAYPDDLATA